jgi:ribosomal protein S17
MAINNEIIKTNIRKPATVSGIAKVHEGTLKVSVESVIEHSKYHKQQKRHRNYSVICEKNSQFSVGQRVFITPCRRVSKTKSWKILAE